MTPQHHADSLFVGDSLAATPDSITARPRQKTVRDVLRALPPDATPTEQDDAVQAAFPRDTLTWPEGVELSLPGIETKAYDAELRPINEYETAFERHSPWKLERLPYHQEGIAGDPLPYRFRTDDYVTSALLLCFFLGAWVVARSFRFIRQQIKDFFFTRQHDNLFTPDAELRGQFFLVFQTCFVLSVLFFDYTQEYMTSVFNQVSPYKLLAADVAISLCYYAVKLTGYAFVNWIFFTKEQNERWSESYMLCLLALGTALYPVALLVVYFDLSFRATLIVCTIILGIVKVLLFYKCHAIFFQYRLAFLHLFLYFCTLEILPMLVLWRALVYANNYLVINF